MKKMYSVLLSVFTLLVIFLFSDYCEAGFISIKIETKATVTGNRLKLDINVTNKGDESAFNVIVSADLNGDQKASQIKEELKVNSLLHVEFIYDLMVERQGKYPVILTVDYTDANFYNFSTFSAPLFIYKENVSAAISCKIDKVEIVNSGKLNLVVKNLDEIRKNIRCKLVLSKELTISNPVQNITLLPKSEENIVFHINNASALEGSNYSGFAILEYDINDKHYSSISPGVVKIITGKKFAVKYKWVVIVSVSVLFVIFVVLQFLGKHEQNI